MRSIVNEHASTRGIVGDVTGMTYKDGSPIQVGDIVKVATKLGTSHKDSFIIHNSGRYTHSHASGTFINGIDEDDFWRIQLVKKWYDVKVGTVLRDMTMIQTNTKKTIMIGDKKIEISLESFNELKKQLIGEEF